jgi:hypothetical protein
MINPVSSQSGIYLQQMHSSKPATPPDTQPPSTSEDSVQLSAHAHAALSSGDVDHDGDSH